MTLLNNENTKSEILANKSDFYSIDTVYTLKYEEISPLNLVFQTVHPDDKEQNLIVSFFNMEECLSYTLTADDENNPANRRELHQHNYFELCYIISGEMYQNIEHKRHLYPEGSLCILNQNIHHAEEFSTEYRCVFVNMSMRLIKELFLQSDSFYFSQEETIINSPITNFFLHNLSKSVISVREYMDFILCPEAISEKDEMYQRFETLLKQFLSPIPGSTYLLKATLLEIFSALIDETKYHTVPVSIGTEKEARIFDSINQLFAESNGHISRSELENAMNYHGAYLNKIVKKYTGLNLFNYGMTICMKEACRLLRETNMSVSEIADTLQFSNRTHFYKIFENTYHMTPRQYRQIHIASSAKL